MDLLAIISSYFPSLSKSEQKVAQLVLSNPDEVENFAINELASKANVGESTVVRFTRKIGFKGFQDFKLSLVRSQSTQKIPIESKDHDITDLVFSQFTESLTETQAFSKQEEFQLAAEKISKAQRVFLFAVGTSGFIAELAANRFKRLGKTVEYVTDPYLQVINSSMMNEKDLAIAISTSGNTEKVISCIEMAKENSAFVISITNYMNSKVAELGNLSLIASAKEFISDSGSSAAAVSQLFIIDTLCKHLVELDPDKYHKLRDRTNKALLK